MQNAHIDKNADTDLNRTLTCCSFCAAARFAPGSPRSTPGVSCASCSSHPRSPTATPPAPCAAFAARTRVFGWRQS